MEPSVAQPRPAIAAGLGRLPLNWVLVALISHTAWGGYTVLARYLQNVDHLPSLSLVSMTNALAALVLAFTVLPKMDRRKLWSRSVFIFSIIVCLRSVTNVLAARFTLAIYVQLITLLTPFFVAALSNLLLHEPIPRSTGRAILLSMVGSVLMVTASLGGQGVTLAITPEDWIGISLAFASSFFLALYMITIRRMTTTGIPPQTVAVVQVYSLLFAMAASSLLIGEDWSAWGRLEPSGWVAFVFFSLGVVLVGTMLQNASLRHLKASFYTTLQAWRLVSTAGLAALMLGEWFSSGWQVVGAFIVMATITWYSLAQNAPEPVKPAVA